MFGNDHESKFDKDWSCDTASNEKLKTEIQTIDALRLIVYFSLD